MMTTFRVSFTDVKDDTEEYYSKKVKKVFEAPKGPKGRCWCHFSDVEILRY